ncbi:MAG: methionine adenosyltransferase [Leptospirales bacterium]|nr:methionine adenosyltransferase [Leptospirales bacterium]
MPLNNFIFTSESVSEGHPDKVCDQISDAILDAHIKGDPMSRVALETLATTNLIVLSGEITSSQAVDYEKIAREVVTDIGYTDPGIGFDDKSCVVQTHVHAQSSDISQGVTEGEGLYNEQGAGDQGMMFGYAVSETPELMPMPILLSHKLVKRLAEARRAGEIDFLKPDAKSQVTVQYENGKPKRIDTIVVSTQHADSATLDMVREAVIELVVKKAIPADLIDSKTKYFVNPTGRFVIGGPNGDTGLTGRKIIVDTYGGMGRHGGGAFSGKDPSKVDRSAAYMARYIAKNVVAAGLAYRCEIQLSYAIGVAEPISVMADTFGTSSVSEDEIVKRIKSVFNMKPAGILEMLDLRKPIFRMTTNYGHFGREDCGFVWEKTDKAELLK